jgi:hypothetical protein
MTEQNIVIGRAYCMQFTLRYARLVLEAAKLHGRPQTFITCDDKPITYDEAFRCIQQMKDEGMEVIPSCDNVDEKTGRCLGHDKE